MAGKSPALVGGTTRFYLVNSNHNIRDGVEGVFTLTSLWDGISDLLVMVVGRSNIHQVLDILRFPHQEKYQLWVLGLEHGFSFFWTCYHHCTWEFFLLAVSTVRNNYEQSEIRNGREG
jgi:hypothetical protein